MEFIKAKKSKPNPYQNKINNAYQHVQDIDNQKTTDSMIGSKEKHIVEQEKPNKFFFDQEKQKQKAVKDSKIQQNDETITLTADFEILKYCKTFFLNFYSKTQTNSELQQ